MKDTDDQRMAGLYLHIPFCARVCPYCDFAVRTGDRARRRRFVDHLVSEIELNVDWPLRFDTVYFGGGTPSALEAEDLERILDAVRDHLKLAERTWIFLEANPEDVTAESVAAWSHLGIDTLSLGVQSLDPVDLDFLGRTHGVGDARNAVSLALDAGFETVSIDLIYGLPGQQPSAWRAQLDRALELGAQHFSCYTLTIHEGTRFGLLERRGELTPLPTDEQAELFRLTHRHLNAAGVQGYEVSNFATSPEHRSRHNIKYWDHTPYLGLGPSAHSFHDGKRWWNLRRTDPWQERLSQGQRPIDETESLDTKALVLEALMLGLRTYDGVNLERLRSRWGVDVLGSNPELLSRLDSEGLVTMQQNHLVPTLNGLAVADSLAPLFKTDPAG
jgi:oxygen-independent coproporphyrinogen-3 oxidase